jgi:UDP-2,3-diacylglucosamine pyrophosphatase LpxH
MSKTSLIVLSDLHLADGHPVLEGFRTQQQAALEGLLRAALAQGEPTSLIINGDCFDFLIVPPYLEDGWQTPQIALGKLEKIAQAHVPFFAALRDFTDQGGTVTFLPGNHDIELCFAEIRDRILQLIAGDQSRQAGVFFGLDQSYRPLPDVSIEHGNQYDFWNYSWGIWDAAGKAWTPQPVKIRLSIGTQYVQRSGLPTNIRYPYFDHFEPPIGTSRQLALLSLIDPELVVAAAKRTVHMLSYPYEALQNLVPGDELKPARLFEQAIPDFLAFQQDALAATPEWQAVENRLYTPEEQIQNQGNAWAEYLLLQAALEQSTDAALKTIFRPVELADDFLNRGIHTVLREQPDLRSAISGHTHLARWDSLPGDRQVYVNTGSWTTHQALPDPAAITPEWLAWLRQPEIERYPGQDLTAYTFAWIHAETGKPARTQLCVWEGGSNGNYRILHDQKE